ncbi:MAG: hypothetical protein KJO04_06370 [Bacteroidia bacterium]|nr:hypothetical protein [Bacteroidia bacterium]
MRIFKVIFDFYLDASIHVAFAVLSLIWISCMSLDIPVDFPLLIFVFAGSIAVYNFIKYGVEAKKYLLVSNTYHKRIQFISLIFLGLAAYYSSFLNLEIYIALAVIAILVGLYALPLLPRASKLRNWGVSKVIIISVVWTIATVLLPVLQADQSFTWDVWIVFFQRVLFVLAWIIPFEIRDLKFDSPDLHTIPQAIGQRNTKKLGNLLLVIMCLMTYFKDYVAPMEFSLTIFIAAILALFIWSSNREQRPYFASFFVEGIPILWMGIWWVLQAN